MKYILSFLAILVLMNACTFTQKMRDGEMAFEYKHYQQAISMLTEEYNHTKIVDVQARKAFLIAESYVLNDEMEEALPWYRKAYEANFGDIALAKYANTLKKLEKYEAAIKVYDSLLENDRGNPDYRLGRSGCERALRFKSNPKEYIVEPVKFNSVNSDYSPVFYKDGLIVFTSDRSTATGEDLYAWTGNKHSDFFISSATATSPTHFNSIINSDEVEGSIAFNSDFSIAIFTRCGVEEGGDGFCKLYFSRKKRYGWADPLILDFIQDGFNYQNPTLSNTDSVLIFSAQLPGGQGGYDLYYSLLSPEDGWMTPVPLSQKVNSPDHEKFPYLYRDTLYFASNKPGGMGGLDIYKTWQMLNGEWSNPQFLPAPINGGADDFGIIIAEDALLDDNEIQKGFFSSSRNKANKDDIFSFVELVPIDRNPVVIEKVKEIEFEIFLAVKVVENLFSIKDDPNSEIIGSTPIVNALVTINGNTQETDANGTVIVQIQFEEDYNLSGGKPGYLRNLDQFDTRSIEKDSANPITTINRELKLSKIFKGKEIVLENIYYDLDKWFIRTDAQPTLDSLAKIMALNPFINIQLGSHTDCRGEDQYNLDLSHKRAKSATSYLISLGIKRSRLKARGFGKGVLIEKCDCEDCDEEQHQKNRRTTFTIL